MSARGWAACAAVLAVMLAGCDQRTDPAEVKVTQTVQACDQIRAMRDAAYQGTRIGVSLGFGNEDGALHDRGTRIGVNLGFGNEDGALHDRGVRDAGGCSP